MWILIAGPYTSGAKTESDRESNLLAMNRAAYQVFRKGHVPVIGVNHALPVIQAAGPETFDSLMMPLSLALADRCDAVLRIGGASAGADEEAERIRTRGGHVYSSIDEIPDAAKRDEESPHDATRVVGAGLPEPSQGLPFLPGPVFAGPFHLAGDPARSPYTYGRYHNPTWAHFERALGELEGGEAVVFASGMAATAAVLGSVLRPGDVAVLPADGYYTARILAEGYFAQMGVQVRTAPTAGDAQGSCLDGAKLLWLESPSNPGLDVCDIAALARAAHERGTTVAVDNTTATVLGQRPLSLGADYSLASDTKALTGHGDVVLGHVAVREARRAEELRSWRAQFGAVPGPMEVWLAHRSLGTLDVRLERMTANALTIARFLAGRPEVRRVRYPGLPGDPAHPVAARQMSRFGPVVGFELASAEAAETFLDRCRLIFQATSFGGLHTTAERRARWGGDQVPEGFIRLSAGCEHAADLLRDLAGALTVSGA